MIISICSNPDVLKVMKIVNIVIWIIRIAVPVLLLISGAILFLNEMKSDSVELNKSLKILLKKCIAAIIIFLVPTFVNLIVAISGGSDYRECLNVDDDKINDAYNSRMIVLIENVNNSLYESDYNIAISYLNNIKDETKKREYAEQLKEIKTKIEEEMKKKNGSSTGYGKELVASPVMKEACRWVLNPESINIRLITCSDSHQYSNPNAALPGGASAYQITENGETITNYKAKKTITFEEYQRGAWAGEIGTGWSRSFDQMFAILYKQVIIDSIGRRVAKNPNYGNYDKKGYYTYNAGSCTQNYRQNMVNNNNADPAIKEKIDSAIESTKYFILVDSDGEPGKYDLTEVRYNVSSGVVKVWKQAQKNEDFRDILEAMRSGHTLDYRYKNATLYDCRNLLEENQSSGNENAELDENLNIIHTGDSRTDGYRIYKDYIGIDSNKETIYSKAGTGYDDDFKSHMNSAKKRMKNNPDKTYAVTVNYGVNSKSAYKSFCDYYVNFVKDMDKKNSFYIVSVNPFDESKVTSYKQSNTNANVEIFNNYMKNECINRIKSEVPDAKVHYCDVYGSMPLDKWASSGYVNKDGIHYTIEGYKYIYNETKKCIARNQ